MTLHIFSLGYEMVLHKSKTADHSSWACKPEDRFFSTFPNHKDDVPVKQSKNGAQAEAKIVIILWWI